MSAWSEPSVLSGKIRRIMDEAPPHIRAGLLAYRDALNLGQDWHQAVTAAIKAAEIEREKTS
jgi:hypothetical protein